MRVLVSGMGGQLGTEVARAAKNRGHMVDGRDHAGLDIADARAVERAGRSFDAIINAAAYTDVDGAEENVDQAFVANETGPRNLAGVGVPLLHASTDYVFDGRKQTLYAESDPVAPQSVYGRSKLAGENAIRQISPKHLILRTSWVFGLNGSNFVKTMLRLGRERPVLRVVDDQFGGPTLARAVAETLVAMMERTAQPAFDGWGTYHYAGRPVVSWRGFAIEVMRQAGLEVDVQPISAAAYGAAAPRPANSAFDCNKMLRVFGIEQPDWRLAIADLLGSNLAGGRT